MAAPLVLDASVGETMAERLLAKRRAGAETLYCGVGAGEIALEPGDLCDSRRQRCVRDCAHRRWPKHASSNAVRVRHEIAPVLSGVDPSAPRVLAVAPTPAFSVLDLPPLPGEQGEDRPLFAAFASPLVDAHDIFARALAIATRERRSTSHHGELVWDLWPGSIDRWDEANVVRIALYGGRPRTSRAMRVLNGANLRPAGARIVKRDQRLAWADVGAHEWAKT